MWSANFKPKRTAATSRGFLATDGFLVFFLFLLTINASVSGVARRRNSREVRKRRGDEMRCDGRKREIRREVEERKGRSNG